MKFEKLDPCAVIPSRGTTASCGYDLLALNSGVVPIGERLLIPTGIQWLRENTADDWLQGHIRPRSGHSYKKGIMVMAGVIDADYTGDIGVILYNSGEEPFEFGAGSAVAQMVIETYQKVSNDLHDKIERGDGAYGSTER